MEKNDLLLNLKKLEEAAAACNRCGFCTSYCPTYKATGSEVHSPRGRNQIVRALIEGKLDEPALAQESVESCLLCGECTSVCFSEVPTARLMMEARDYLNRKKGIPKLLDLFFQKILPCPARFQRLMKIAFISKNMGVSHLLRASGILKRISPVLEAADNLMPKAPMKFLLEHKETKPYQQKIRSEMMHASMLKQQTAKPVDPILPIKAAVAYLPVCGSQYLRPDIGLATIKLLKLLKIDLIIPEAVCCGLPAASVGINERVCDMARQNIVRFERDNFDHILVDDSSCTSHLKEMAHFFQSDGAWMKRAHDISQKIREVSTFLAQRGLKEHLKLAPWLGGAVAYHDPCKAQYGQRLIDPPRDLLKSIPRLKLVPIAEADQCCGGAGTYSFTHPDMSQQVLAAKVKNIVASGCNIVVTSSASCLVQLAFGLRSLNSNIEVLHLTEFLVRALEKKK